ncbi:hypothetical protein [Parvibaculum sp.]|uniref:hypothetical protein n=1 Tax=Parvibaculum sp. TaxID=2024848 RepID=UPI000C8CC391|nr:hypothetical protein [Parvibaculum sp.]MAB14023.1 hypothetical protein [Parvibaculum sp.]
MKKIAVTLVAATSAFAMWAGAASADVFMTGKQVAKEIVGNTIEGQYRECAADRNDFQEYYDPDGTIRGRERPCRMSGSWSRYGGSWEVKDGKFCVTLGSGRSSGCFDYNIGKDGMLTRYNAVGVTDLKFKVYDGNPDHL